MVPHQLNNFSGQNGFWKKNYKNTNSYVKIQSPFVVHLTTGDHDLNKIAEDASTQVTGFQAN